MGPELIMAGSILPDTDVLVDFLGGHSKAVAFIKAHPARIILSSITVAELYTGVKGDAEQAAPKNFVSLFPVVPIPICHPTSVVCHLFSDFSPLFT